jgi:hypothetical protein
MTQALTKAETTAPFSYIDRIGGTDNPFSRGSVVIARSDQLTLLGWAIDPDSTALAAGVDVAIDGVPYAARYGLDRPDVAAAFKAPACRQSGVEFSMPAALLSKAEHRLTLRVVPQGKKLYYESAAMVLRVE